VDYELNGAHGVLWDPEYEVLWGLGGYELVAYAVSGSGTKEKISKISDMGTSIKNLGYGHDLQPDYTDTRYLYFTAGNVYRFDKETNKAGSFPIPRPCSCPKSRALVTTKTESLSVPVLWAETESSSRGIGRNPG